MVIELALAGMMQCFIAHKKIVEDDINCFYQSTDTTKEFASTLKEYSCPKVLHVERKPLPFKERDRKANKWTQEQMDKINEPQ